MGKYKALENGYINEATDEWRFVEPAPMPEENDDWGFVVDQLKPKNNLSNCQRIVKGKRRWDD